MKMKDKVVLITGGGKGIGLGVSRAFAKEGANLVLTGRTMSSLQEAKDALEKDYNIKVLIEVADGSDVHAVKRVIANTVDMFGRIDCVINNAQASKSGLSILEHSAEDFDLTMKTGVYATFFYMKEAFPYLKEVQGSVINFASGAGLGGRAGHSAYAASKEGIRGLSRVAATEWGPFGINVNVVCPLVKTPALEKWQEEYPELYANTIKSIPLGRFGDAETDIGRICVFLASEDASYISGETITVQGGSGLRP